MEVEKTLCSAFGIFPTRKDPPFTKALGGENKDPGEGTAGRGISLVGEFLPGGLNGCFTGDSGLEDGVAERDPRRLDAGRCGGPICRSGLAMLGLRRVGEGEDGIFDSVSRVLSVSEGRGLRF